MNISEARHAILPARSSWRAEFSPGFISGRTMGNTVAVSGTAFTAEHAALIRRMTDNLVLLRLMRMRNSQSGRQGGPRGISIAST